MLTSAMQDVVTSGTGTACQLDNMAVAGKTGTTEAYNDLWFVGYTPYYTCAVWSGFDNNEKLPEDARNFHKNLWRKVMTRIHEGMDYKEFSLPSNVQEVEVCAGSGLLPRAGCDTIIEYFEVDEVPYDYCEQHFYEYVPEVSLTPTPEPEQEIYYEETTPDYTEDENYYNPEGDGGEDYSEPEYSEPAPEETPPSTEEEIYQY